MSQNYLNLPSADKLQSVTEPKKLPTGEYVVEVYGVVLKSTLAPLNIRADLLSACTVQQALKLFDGFPPTHYIEHPTMWLFYRIYNDHSPLDELEHQSRTQPSDIDWSFLNI